MIIFRSTHSKAKRLNMALCAPCAAWRVASKRLLPRWFVPRRGVLLGSELPLTQTQRQWAEKAMEGRGGVTKSKSSNWFLFRVDLAGEPLSADHWVGLAEAALAKGAQLPSQDRFAVDWKMRDVRCLLEADLLRCYFWVWHCNEFIAWMLRVHTWCRQQ